MVVIYYVLLKLGCFTVVVGVIIRLIGWLVVVVMVVMAVSFKG